MSSWQPCWCVTTPTILSSSTSWRESWLCERDFAVNINLRRSCGLQKQPGDCKTCEYSRGPGLQKYWNYTFNCVFFFHHWWATQKKTFAGKKNQTNKKKRISIPEAQTLHHSSETHLSAVHSWVLTHTHTHAHTHTLWQQPCFIFSRLWSDASAPYHRAAAAAALQHQLAHAEPFLQKDPRWSTEPSLKAH